jgi:ubiquinone biosynthesis protein
MGEERTITRKRTRVRYYGRYREIALILIKYRLGELLRTLGLDRFLPFHWVPPANPWHKEIHTRSQRTRMALEELGTTFVKMGQILSTRTDILPSDYIGELTKLQDSLTPVSLEVVNKVIEQEFGRTTADLFAYFEPRPLGVASIGQAHAATLKDGTEVVVKVQKPGVREQVLEDLEILHYLAGITAKRGGGWQHYDLVGLVEEMSDTLKGELDYIREGHSAEHFARFFQADPLVHIPRVIWNCTTSRVITLERIRGINIQDVASLEKGNFDRRELAKRTVGIWIRMIFENNVFHADPHPGNLFVESDGRLGLVDFGMIGLVDDEVRFNIAGLLKGIVDRDVDLLVESLFDLGAVTPTGSRENLRKDLKHLMTHYPILDENLVLHSNLDELFTVVRRNHIQLPGSTFLLIKTIAMVQGLGWRMDSDLDFLNLVTPSVVALFNKKYRASEILRRLPAALAELTLFGVGLPKRLTRITKSIERGDFKIRSDVSGVELHLEHLERIVNRLVMGLIVAAVIFAVALVLLIVRMGQ